jgi:DNA-binding transcriptional regulator YhcF (GntR family)
MARTTVSVPLSIRRDAPSPIVRQIADQLVALVRAGTLPAGERLPPVRMLAGFLRVNRNTVAKVYAALERQGWIESVRGRGTFVRSGPSPDPAALAAYADRLLAEAAAYGMGVEEVHELISGRAAVRRDGARSPRVGFVECNPSDLAYFTRQLAARLRVPLVPVLLADVPRAATGLDIVATTLFHVEEVRARLPSHDVIGLMAAPDFRTLDAVAHLPSGSRIALVCATREGVKSKERSIRAVGIPRARIRSATLQHPARLHAALAGADVVLASPKVLERLSGQIPPRARVIPFASVLGEGAVGVLEQRIQTWRPRRRRPGSLGRSRSHSR